MSSRNFRWLIVAAPLALGAVPIGAAEHALETYGEFFDRPGWAEPAVKPWL